MVLSDRFLTALKTFLEARDGDLAEVRLRDWDGTFKKMTIVLDVEDEPVEDEEMRGLYEMQATINLRCESGVTDEDRRAMFEAIEEVVYESADGAPEEFDFVRWCRTEANRGITGELGVFDLLVGSGSWEVTDEEVTGTIEVTASVMEADLTDANFGL
jgi:hypothetical protein